MKLPSLFLLNFISLVINGHNSISIRNPICVLFSTIGSNAKRSDCHQETEKIQNGIFLLIANYAKDKQFLEN